MKRITNKRVFSKQANADAQKHEGQQKRKDDRSNHIMSRASRSAPELSLTQLKALDHPDAPQPTTSTSTTTNYHGWQDFDTRYDLLHRIRLLDDKERVDTRLIMKLAQCDKSTALDMLTEMRVLGLVRTYSSYYILTPECKTKIEDYLTRSMKRPKTAKERERERDNAEIERLAALPDDDEQPIKPKQLTRAERERVETQKRIDALSEQQDRSRQRDIYLSGMTPDPRKFSKIYMPEELGINVANAKKG